MRSARAACLAVLVALLVANTATALQIRSTQSVVIDEGVTVDDDLLVMAQDLTLNGEVTGNLLAMAQRISIAGKVHGSVVAMGQIVECTGPVGGSFHAAGETVDLNAAVERNVTAAGQRVILGDSARVRRDAFLAGESADASGEVARDLKVAANNAVLNGSIGGLARFWVQNLRLTDTARVGRDLVYVSAEPAVVAEGAVVTGGIIHQLPKPAVKPAQWRAFAAVIRVVGFIWLILFTALLVGVLPRQMYDASERIRSAPGWTLLAGFLFIVLGPIAVALLLAFVLPAGLTLLAIWLAFLYAAPVACGIALGSFIFRQFAKREVTRPVLAALTGVVIIWVAELIPVVGWLIRIGVALLGVGALALTVGQVIARSHRSLAPTPPGPAEAP
ncbi:MAG: hypothetical protein JSV65_01860 [Armatimonadota bacterium]|nr:MAG: hypothetical protein JSV65_01860 [Armatimonadota bacterium]